MRGIRQIVLQQPAECSSCGEQMVIGSLAKVDEKLGCVTCASCSVQDEPEVYESEGPGTPGGSAQREFERRRNREKQAAQRQRPIRFSFVAAAAIGGYIAVQIVAGILNGTLRAHTTTPIKPPLPPPTAHGLGILFAVIAGTSMARALWGRRQSTYSWASGAKGERTVAVRLAQLSSKGVLSIHDRRIPGSKANVDHIAVGPSGIYVIDTKVVSGKISARAIGPIWNRGPVKLFVGGRDKTKDIEGMGRQVSAVKNALNDLPWATGVTVTPMLALVGANVGILENPRQVQGVWVCWPKAMARTVSRPGPLSPEVVSQLARTIAVRLSEA